MQDLDHQTQRMNANLTNQISSLKNDVQDAIKSLETKLTTQKLAKDAAIEADEEAAKENANEATQAVAENAWVHVSKVCAISSNIHSLAQTLVRSESNGATMLVSLTLLESLTFSQMNFRHSKVHDAHPNTFNEVFLQKIIPWLRSSEPIFWVSGKPGSGKSTLMKYIVDNPEVHLHLRKSMHGKTPRIASYFFWINGTELQRSQEGLLQSLLYELLCQSPELIEVALPEVWQSTKALARQSHQSSEVTWKRADLLAAIERLSRSEVAENRLCVFIDGLDEYEGDHDSLNDTIRLLEKLGMRMCIASRPWNVFEESFGLNPKSKIYLQDLNRPDIELYVNDKLRNRSEFERARTATRGTDVLIDQLIQEIVEKSQGVFLWVFLVVKSLIDGLRNHDRISQLQKRLRQFPGDLQEFFNHIFQSMDPVYHSQTAQMFQVALQVNKPPSPMLYWYLDELEDSPDLAFSTDTCDMNQSELINRVESSKRRINGRCKGLLEVTATDSAEDGQNFYVDFLHRTVKDFLMTTEIRRVFISWQPEDFDADLAICQSSLAEFKSGADRKAQARGALHNFLYSAKQLELKYQETPTHYLHELERAGELCRSRRGLSSEYPWRLLGVTCFLEVIISADLLLFAKTRCIEFPRLFGIPNSRSTNLFQITNVSLDMAQLTLSNTSSYLGVAVPIGAALKKDFGVFFRLKQPSEVVEWIKMMSNHASFDKCILSETRYLSETKRLSEIQFLFNSSQDAVDNIIKSNIEKNIVVQKKPTRLGLNDVVPVSKIVEETGISKRMLDVGPGVLATALRTAPVRNDSNAISGAAMFRGAQNTTPGDMRGRSSVTQVPNWNKTDRPTHDPYGHQMNEPTYDHNWNQTNVATQQAGATNWGQAIPGTQDVYRSQPQTGSRILLNNHETSPEEPTPKRGFFRKLRRKLLR